MKITKKAVALTICLLLVATMGVFGTMAYFTDQDAALNTFTIGSVTIELDEAEVNPDGTLKSEDRVKGNEYHLVPGYTYIKDPTVTMGEDSELSYVRMLVTVKNIDQLKEAFKESKYYALDPVTEEKVFLLQALCLDEKGVNTWNSQQWPYEGYREVVAEDGTVNGIYEFRYYKAVDDKTTPNKDGKLEPLFEKITVPGEDVNNTDIAYLENVEIHVVAHAIQAAGFADEVGNPDEDAAWDAFNKQNA